ncbi:hypothetical protein GCM10010372_51780 [Streptomyces tauricus]|uniref:hypothetical protein n=1 Tax=Streptomyces tauricus TaxID=68274 RepID=UPI001671FD88|nr:hypothetical protein [Streptomyces tauricus]MCW8103070.1 hypothetical protein [Streptomyces tauricus]GHA45440.1 hypothetical protein GCM10010372_51780 [Streptomyces tauricus]
MNPLLKALCEGELVELPATIDEIRASTHPAHREEFERELGSTAFNALPHLLMHWAIRAGGAEPGTPFASVTTDMNIPPFV